jgi:hypothetical protein
MTAAQAKPDSQLSNGLAALLFHIGRLPRSRFSNGAPLVGRGEAVRRVRPLRQCGRLGGLPESTKADLPG